MRKNYLYETLFVIIAMAALFTGLSLFSYNDADPSLLNSTISREQLNVHNIFGKVGAYAAGWLGAGVGWCALFIPFALVYLLLQLIKLYRAKISRVRAVGALLSVLLFIFFASALSGIVFKTDIYFKGEQSGGIFGVAGANAIAGVLGKMGGALLCTAALLLSLLGIINLSLTELARRLSEKFKEIKRRSESEEDKESIVKRVFSWLKNSIADSRERGALKKAERESKQRQLEEEKLRNKEDNFNNNSAHQRSGNTESAVTAKKEDDKRSDSVVQQGLSYMQPFGKGRIVAEGLTPEIPGITPPPLIVPPFYSEESEEPKVNAEPIEYEENAEAASGSYISEIGLPSEEGGYLTVSEWEEMLASYEKSALEVAAVVGKEEPPLAADSNKPSAPKLPRAQNITSYRDYTIPLSLLDLHDNKTPPPEQSELRQKAELLLNKLRDFGVDGRVVEIHPGPVVTLFVLELAPGIKISRVATLENDLALAMSALSIRIIAPIPGKAAIGIEIPNPIRAMVSLRELLEAREFRQDISPLAVTLGKDISGKPYFADLRKMPHLLVAGTTGSGKSVCVNSIICSVIYKSAPDKVKFVMIDPKMVELSVYEGIPHLGAPVVTDPRKASAVLQNVVKEMEARYGLLASCKVRSMDSYNDYIQAHPQNADGEPYYPMPYMVVIVDEFADLMMVAGKDVEISIMRIAQMARAVGIHLVLATQRPSVNVITGIIKANMPARISFKVSSKIDSRTILDQNGAELLLGSGDSLFVPPGTSDTMRIHGCYVSEKEILRVVEELKKYGEPEYNMALLEERGENSAKFDEEEDIDSLYDEALKIVREKGFASISMIQRYLKIGYNRSARIVETMERQGLIAPSDGTSKPRELLKKD